MLAATVQQDRARDLHPDEAGVRRGRGAGAAGHGGQQHHAAEAQSRSSRRTSSPPAAQIRALVPLALEAMQTEHEADRTTSIMMSRALVAGLRADRRHAAADDRRSWTGSRCFRRACGENLDLSGGLIMAEALMLELGKQIGRQRAHDAVYEAAQASVTQARPFRETLAEDPARERPAHAGRRSRRCSTPPGTRGSVASSPSAAPPPGVRSPRPSRGGPSVDDGSGQVSHSDIFPAGRRVTERQNVGQNVGM